MKKSNGINRKKFNGWFWGLFFTPILMLALLFALIGYGAFGKLPTFEELENPRSNLATEIYSADGKLLGSFFIQNRSFVDYNDLSPYLVQALIATEDTRFYNHSGIDFKGLARVAVRTLLLGDKSQGGGSTISQQLAKNLYRTREDPRLVIAKLKEWITALMLEYNYTKEEIIAMYFNTVEYGSNAFGIKSAARTFFNKLPSTLTAEEAAMLVGVVKAPTRYSPRLNPERALQRRNTVLTRMEARGFLAKEMKDSISALPIALDYTPISHNEGTATYFREMLRLTMTAKRPEKSAYQTDWDYRQEVKQWDENPLYGWCLKNKKADGTNYDLYRDGLKIYTTIDSRMQRYAEEALVSQMEKSIQPAMDAQVSSSNTLFNDLEPEDVDRIINNAMRQSDRYRMLKKSNLTHDQIIATFDQKSKMKIFTYKGVRDTVMTPKDSILHYKRYMRAGFVAMDPATGYVKAYVGGPNFRYFKYDAVKQGRRQVGSTIKPFIYTFAIDHLGLSPCTAVPNMPVTIETYTGDAWQPKEAGKVVYDGALKPLWWGLAQSRNNYSAWIMKQARQPGAVADFIHKMGIRSYVDPVFAMCLGTSDFSLYEMVGAYTTYANKGVYSEPMFVTRVEDRQGNLLAEFSVNTVDAISEQTAYTMVQMMQNVVNKGTAGRLRWMYNFKGELAGKTGTSQNGSDAWFMGVVPRLVSGAWVGGEDRSVHLTSKGEGATMALPIFATFMQKVYADKSLGISESDMFPVPMGAKKIDCELEDFESQSQNEVTNEDEFFD